MPNKDTIAVLVRASHDAVDALENLIGERNEILDVMCIEIIEESKPSEEEAALERLKDALKAFEDEEVVSVN